MNLRLLRKFDSFVKVNEAQCQFGVRTPDGAHVVFRYDRVQKAWREMIASSPTGTITVVQRSSAHQIFNLFLFAATFRVAA